MAGDIFIVVVFFLAWKQYQENGYGQLQSLNVLISEIWTA